MVPTKRAERLLDDPALLKARLRASPSGAGVYVMRGVDARVIYVGKAANVRNRLRSWFTGIDTLQARTHQLIASVFDFEVIACQSEHEALVLENTLIKQHRACKRKPELQLGASRAADSGTDQARSAGGRRASDCRAHRHSLHS